MLCRSCGKILQFCMYVCNRGDFLSQDGLREEARSIPFARSAASNWNHTWQPVLDVFLTTQVSNRSHCAGHGGRSLVCLFLLLVIPLQDVIITSDSCKCMTFSHRLNDFQMLYIWSTTGTETRLKVEGFTGQIYAVNQSPRRVYCPNIF